VAVDVGLFMKMVLMESVCYDGDGDDDDDAAAADDDASHVST